MFLRLNGWLFFFLKAQTQVLVILIKNKHIVALTNKIQAMLSFNFNVFTCLNLIVEPNTATTIKDENIFE